MNVDEVNKPAPQRESAFSRIRSGTIKMPLRILGYGAEGVGKSTFASGAPRPLWLGAEGGTMALSVDRLPEPKTWDDAMDAVRDVRHERHDYQTLVLDPLGWLEALNWAKLTKGKGSIESFGYGKGYVAALQQWREFLDLVAACWSERGMNIVALAHANMRQHPNPTGPTFPQWMPALDKQAAGLWAQWVDHVLFMQVETIALEDEASKRTLGQVTGLRLCHAAPSGGWVAKSRGLPNVFPLSWAAMTEALAGSEARTAAARAELEALLEGMEPAYVAAVRAYAATPMANIQEAVNRVKTKKGMSK